MKNSVVKQNPILIGALSGMFPAIYYCIKNFGLVYSSRHFFFFTICFVVLPIFIYVVVNSILSSFKYDQLKQHWGPFFSFVYFFGSINFLNFGGKLELLLFLVSFWEGLYLAMGLRHTLSNFFFFNFF